MKVVFFEFFIKYIFDPFVCLVISDQKTTTPTMIIELRGFYYNYVTFLESFIESQTE